METRIAAMFRKLRHSTNKLEAQLAELKPTQDKHKLQQEEAWQRCIPRTYKISSHGMMNCGCVTCLRSKFLCAAYICLHVDVDWSLTSWLD